MRKIEITVEVRDESINPDVPGARWVHWCTIARDLASTVAHHGALDVDHVTVSRDGDDLFRIEIIGLLGGNVTAEEARSTISRAAWHLDDNAEGGWYVRSVDVDTDDGRIQSQPKLAAAR